MAISSDCELTLSSRFTQNKPVTKLVSLGSSDSLKILLTAKEGNKAKRPHQAFLNLRESEKSLETSFALQLKETGKGKVEIVCSCVHTGHFETITSCHQSQKDLPTQLLASSKPLEASLVIASFGSSTPYKSKAFDLSIALDSPIPKQETRLRYGKLPEIHHLFRTDPTSPPKIITLFFTFAVIAALPVLLGAWLTLGANLNHLTKAFSASPISYTLYFLSILAMEGAFFMYYTSWNLFQTLPATAGIGLVTFLSGTRVLREVQGRRLAGFR